MEEIRSSEALDREILEDARKKAERILKQVDVDAGQLRVEWENRTLTEIAALEKRMKERARAFEEEIQARAPLEKKRKKIDFIERKLDEAILSVFSGMEPGTCLSIVGEKLRRVSRIFSGKPVIVEALGIAKKEAAELVLREIPGIRIVRIEESPVRGDEAGILLTAEDGSARYRATFAEVKAELLDSYREELARALYPALDEI